jgi:hypothetical protein
MEHAISMGYDSNTGYISFPILVMNWLESIEVTEGWGHVTCKNLKVVP